MGKNPRRFTSRTKARKRAADLVFEAEQRGILRKQNGLAELLEERRTLSASESPLPEYSAQIVTGVAQKLREIDRLLESRAKVPGLDRLPGVDLAVMRVAVWEMIANPDVDAVVAIDEAIAIVKSISTDRSPAFVNAVLDAIREDAAQLRIAEDASQPVEATAEDLAPEGTATPDEGAATLTDEELDELLYEY